jgi:uncharacterized SAM-binding protein YcdF (DUF218 family)
MLKDWYLIKSNSFIKYTMIVVIVIVLIYLIVASIFVRDLVYPKERPYLFTIETLLFSFGVASIYFLMAYGRGTLSLKSLIEFSVIAAKFGVMHILFQFSGFYTYAFSKL